MTEDLRGDAVLDSLRGLPKIDVDRARSERIRERCYRELRGSRWQRTVARVPSLSTTVTLFEPAVLTMACLAFLSEIARRAIVLLTQARP